MATMTAQAFNRDVSAAKRLAEDEPLFITHRGKPAFVLLTIEEYERIGGRQKSLLEALRADDDIEIEFPRADFDGFRIPDFD